MYPTVTAPGKFRLFENHHNDHVETMYNLLKILQFLQALLGLHSVALSEKNV